MAKIELTVAVYEKKTFDIEFPLYRMHECSDHDYTCVYYSRHTADNVCITIRVMTRQNVVEYELNRSHYVTLNGDDSDYILAKGNYHELSSDEFNAILGEATEFLNSFRI